MPLTCPMCRKLLEPAVSPCPRCRSDLGILVDFMHNLDEHLAQADAALKSGEIGDAVFAYLNVLETDPEHPVARRQVTKVATAVRQFDEAKRTGNKTFFLFGAAIAAAAFAVAAIAFVGGYVIGQERLSSAPSVNLFGE